MVTFHIWLISDGSTNNNKKMKFNWFRRKTSGRNFWTFFWIFWCCENSSYFRGHPKEYKSKEYKEPRELLILQINLTLIPLTLIQTNILTNFRSSQSEMWQKLIWFGSRSHLQGNPFWKHNPTSVVMVCCTFFFLVNWPWQWSVDTDETGLGYTD